MFKGHEHNGIFEIKDSNLEINNDIQEIMGNLLQKENFDQSNEDIEISRTKTDKIEISAGSFGWNINNSDKNEGCLEIFNAPQINYESVINNIHELDFTNDNINTKLSSSDKYDHKDNISKLHDCWAIVEVLKLEIDHLINCLDGISFSQNNDELEVGSITNGTNSDRLQMTDAYFYTIPDMSIDQLEINNDNSQANAFSEILYNENTFWENCLHKNNLNNLNDCSIIMHYMKAEFNSLSNYLTKICVAINSCDVSETLKNIMDLEEIENITNFEVENMFNFKEAEGILDFEEVENIIDFEEAENIIDFEEAENILSYFATIEKFLLDIEMQDNETFDLNTFTPNEIQFNESVNNDNNSNTSVFPFKSNFKNLVINLSSDTEENEWNKTIDSCDIDDPVNLCNEITSINVQNAIENCNENDDVIIIEDEELQEELDDDVPEILKVVSLRSRYTRIFKNSLKNNVLSHSDRSQEKSKVINNMANTEDVIIKNKDLKTVRTQNSNLKNTRTQNSKNNNVKTTLKRKLSSPVIKTYWTRSKIRCQLENSNELLP